MTITIPIWVLWLIGIPLAAYILFLAFVGFSLFRGWDR